MGSSKYSGVILKIPKKLISWSISTAIFLTVVLVTIFFEQRNYSSMDHHLGITWTKGPDSWDPLDFDLGNNISFARMVFSTPFEISKDGQITSYILSSFRMSESGKELEMIIDPTKKFSDGSEMTANDLTLAILRMALARPEFPVLKDIEGLTNWRQMKSPLRALPSGITVVGNVVNFFFNSPQRQALFRLSLEVFSIIPSKCIDLDTSKLICEKPPESGQYRLASRVSFGSGLKKIDFISNNENTKPTNVSISYIKNKDIKDFLKNHDGAIVHTSDLEHSADKIKEYSNNYEVFETPKAWFGVIVLSRFSSFFNNKKDRELFRNRFLINLQHQKQSIAFDVETSIFTEIMPGYISKKANINGGAKNFSTKKKILRWISRGIVNEAIIKSLNDTCAHFSLECEEVSIEKYKSADFNAGKVDLIFGKTGFWAKDPLGDLKMLFTPNLHQDLKGVWSDKEIIDELNQIDFLSTGGDLSERLRHINSVIYEQGVFNVFAHFKYYYLTNKNRAKTIQWIPQSVTEPYPWYLFND